MKKFIQASVATVAMTFAMTAKASAAICVLFLCLPTPGTGTTDHAPEIDPVQGVAAVAVLICVGLILREKFRGQRAKI